MPTLGSNTNSCLRSRVKSFPFVGGALSRFATFLASKTYEYGVSCKDQGFHSKSERKFRLALRLDASDERFLAELGRCLLKQGKWQEAAEEYEAAKTRNPAKAEWHHNFWISAHRAGRKEEALQALYQWLAGNRLHDLHGSLLRHTKAAARHLDDIKLNQTFFDSLASKINPDNKAAWATLAVFCSLLGLPSLLGRCVSRADTDSLTPDLLGLLGNAHFRRQHWSEAAQAYAAASTLDPAKAEWYRKLWVSTHRAGRKQDALDALHGWLAGVDLRKFSGLLLHNTQAATRHLDDVDLNRQFVCSLADRISHDDAASRARLAVLSWLLGLPSQVRRFSGQVDGGLLSIEVAACLRAFAFNRADDFPHPSHTGRLALVCWNHNTDERVLQDLARSFGRLVVVAAPTARDRLPPGLQAAVEIVSTRSNLPVDSALDNLIAGQCAEVAHGAIAGLVRTLENSVLAESVRLFAPALQLSFEDRLYNLAIGAASHALLAEQLQPDACIAVTSENVPSEVYFPSTRATSIICAPKTPQHRPRSLADGEWAKTPDKHPNIREFAQNLWAELQKQTNTLFLSRSSAVGILANFSPADFRISPVAPAIFRAVSNRKPCILLQRTNVKAAGEQAIRQFLGLDETDRDGSHCRLWAGLEDIWKKANQHPQEAWSALVSAMFAGMKSLPPRKHGQDDLHAAVVERAVNLFLAKDFRPLLLLGLSARQTFRQNRLASLLIIPEDRNPVARVFTLAAQERGLPVYNYSYLFLSRYARYKKPLADYVFVPSTYHADYFQEHFGLSPSQLIRVGSHAIAARLQEAKGLDPLACRQRFGQSPHRPLMVFFSQPRLLEKSSTALSWILAAAAKADADVAIRLHPAEKHLAAEYEQVIRQKSATDRAWVDHSDASVTEALLAADIVATMWSNVGLEAAALGRAVLAVTVEENPPIDLAGVGVAIGAGSEKAVRQIVGEILTGGPAVSQLNLSRKHFFDRNPELLTGGVEERIANAVCD